MNRHIKQILLLFIFISVNFLNPQISFAKPAIYIHKNSDNRSNDKALDILIVPNNFNDEYKFKSYAQKVSKTITNFSYFKDKKNLYNIKYINQNLDQKKYSCSSSGCYQPHKSKLLKDKYNADVIIVVTESNKFIGNSSFTHEWPDYLANVNVTTQAVNSGGYNIIMHELGHSLGKLNDEYVYNEKFAQNYSKVDGVNCKLNPKDLNSKRYYKGCVFPDMYRATQNTVMRSSNYNNYDQVAKKQFDKLFRVYAPKIDNKEATNPRINIEDYKLKIEWNDNHWHWIQVGKNKYSSNLYQSSQLIKPSDRSRTINLGKDLKNSEIHITYWTWNPNSREWKHKSFTKDFIKPKKSNKNSKNVISKKDVKTNTLNNQTKINVSFKYNNGYMRNKPGNQSGSKIVTYSYNGMKIEVLGKDKTSYWLKYKFKGNEYWSASWLTNITNNQIKNLKVIE